jgi:alcohol dehydrogenase class IV
MALNDFDYHLFGTHVRFGAGVSSGLLNELAAMGRSRPVILTQQRIAGSAKYQALKASLGALPILEIGNIPPHSSVSLIETIMPEVVEFRADCIVAVGGGSVADSAKGLALLLAEQGRLADHVTVFTPPSSIRIPVLTRPKLPIIAIPTTASGAELTPSFGVRNDDHDKLMFWNRQVAASCVLIDPALNEDVPMAIMRYTAMNGIAHNVEGLYSRGRSVVSDGMAVQSMGLFQQALCEPGLPESEQRRLILAAAHLAGMVLGMARSCLHHAICHVVGAHQSLPHGVVNTVILPHALRFNESVVAPLLQPALDVINRRSARRYASLSHWLIDTRQALALPDSLSALGVPEADLQKMAEHVMTERGLALNPRPVADAAEIHAILRQAF